jgi:two-component system, chemotaxis family, chemotaxis protein CheY
LEKRPTPSRGTDVIRRVLVVEDSESTRSLIGSALDSVSIDGGIEVFEASSAFEALRLLPRHSFDLILTDINMPDITGLELVSFIKGHAQYRHIPVVVISTERAQEDMRRARELGAEEYVTKPFEPADLARRVEERLRGSRVKEPQ